MCTLSFISNPKSFTIAMNRDESPLRLNTKNTILYRNSKKKKILIEKQLSEQKHISLKPPFTLYPEDAKAKGTWFACNSYGLIFCLMNEDGVFSESKKSRGNIILKLMEKTSLEDVKESFSDLDLKTYNPFCLFVCHTSGNWLKFTYKEQKLFEKADQTKVYFKNTSSLTGMVEERKAAFLTFYNKYKVYENSQELLRKFHFLENISLNTSVLETKSYIEFFFDKKDHSAHIFYYNFPPKSYEPKDFKKNPYTSLGYLPLKTYNFF